MADTADTPDDQGTGGEGSPTERLRDRIDELERRPGEMQRRLDELGEGIESARRQAQSDELLPEEEGGDDRGPLDELEWPEGDEDRESPVGDDFHPGG
ncbi:MAG TPA: hypothetical protein VFZ30_09470 [Acidimicrobiales bacterium]